MLNRRGFTVVELVVVMVIMAILITFTMVSVTNSQVATRDRERQTDIEILARGLEQRYNQGNPRATESGGMTRAGQYPGINEMIHIDGQSRGTFTPGQIAGGYYTDVLPGITNDAIYSPTGQKLALSCVWACAPAGTMAPITNYTNNGYYVYEPVDKNGNVCCCTGCVRFDLYYKKESTGELVKVTSRHQ